jgi:hypothetical protein
MWPGFWRRGRVSAHWLRDQHRQEMQAGVDGVIWWLQSELAQIRDRTVRDRMAHWHQTRQRVLASRASMSFKSKT